MIRLFSVAAIVASLLVLSANVFANSPQSASNRSAPNSGQVRPSTPLAQQQQQCSCPSGQCQHRSLANMMPGNMIPGNGALGQRLGLNRLRNSDSPLIPMAPPARTPMVPVPVGPPPNNLVEGIFATQQYQRMPMPTGFRPHPGTTHHPGMMHPGLAQTGMMPPGTTHTGMMHPAMTNPGMMHPAMMHPGMMDPAMAMLGYQPEPQVIIQERIVYIPFAKPPPITVERRPPFMRSMRQVLGDARMYEYPQAPLNLYTTRGPRDFLAPNPPSIGF